VGDREFGLLVDPAGRSENLAAYTSGLLITRNHAVFKRNAFETRTFSFEAIPDFTLTTAHALSFLQEHKSTIEWTLFTLVGLGFIPLGWLFFIPIILVFAIPTWFVSAIVRSRLSYGQCVAILFYSVTLPTLIATYMAFKAQPIPGLFFLIYTGWSVVAVVFARQQPAAQIPSSGVAPGSSSVVTGS
jgi:hypothetical protein